ncbi:MAG TPA: IclR family transcriptional regulator [Candidatus Binatia bacterium]|jgi:DNA-binding IclR family transcriptional regulator
MLGTLIKGIRVLELFSVGHPRWRVTEISRELGLNKTAVFRVVETLESEGYLYQDPRDKSYMLTPKLLGLSTVVLSQFNIVEQSKNAIDVLWRATQGTVVVRLFEGKRLLTVAVRESPHVLRVAHNVGTAYDFNYGAIGKAILAYLPASELQATLKKNLPKSFTAKTVVAVPALLEELKRIRRNGYAFSDEEAIEGVRAVGAPIFDVTERPIAGISVGFPSVRFPRTKVAEYGKRVRQAAESISANLGYQRRMTVGK